MDLPIELQDLLLFTAGASVVAVILALVGVPWVITQLPADYFSRPQRTAWRKSSSEPALAVLLGALKNFLGALLVLLGIVMLLTPGQGLLTLLAGLLLMNFPGKYRLERWLVLRPGVLRGLNWLRRRRGQSPFEPPHN